MTKQKGKCPKCNGTGVIFKTDKLHPEGTDTYTLSCPTCLGTGEKKLDRPELVNNLYGKPSDEESWSIVSKLGRYVGFDEGSRAQRKADVNNKLDRPGRETIISSILAEWKDLICRMVENNCETVAKSPLQITKEIIAIIERLIKEAKPDMTKCVSIEDFEKELIHTENMSRQAERVICGKQIEEAREQERERMIKQVEPIISALLYIHNLPLNLKEQARKEWQALKNNKEENIGKDKGKV